MLCSNYSSYGIILLGKFIILRAFLLQMYGKSKKFLKLQLNIGIAEKSLKLCPPPLMVTDDAIQTTYIRSDQEMFLSTSANSSLSHITNNSFSYKTIFWWIKQWYAHYPFVFYSVSYMFKGDVHFHWPEIKR